MLFCDEIFRFMQFEETLMFAALDIDLNSFSTDSLSHKDKGAQIVEEKDLLDIC